VLGVLHRVVHADFIQRVRLGDGCAGEELVTTNVEFGGGGLAVGGGNWVEKPLARVEEVLQISRVERGQRLES